MGGFHGVLETKSALHANHGIASLTLAYFGVEGLPQRMDCCQDLSYFEKGVKFMKNHPLIDSKNGIGIVSICHGSVLALAMAACLKDIRCVVWINSSVAPAVCDLKYKDKYFNKTGLHIDRPDPAKHYKLSSALTKHISGNDTTADIINDMKKRQNIPPFYNQHHISYLFFGSLDDHCCPTAITIKLVEYLMAESDHSDYEVVKYNKAGHLIEPPFTPHADFYFQKGEVFNMYLSCGGATTPHCKAQEDAWQRQLIFLKDKLTSAPQASKL